MADIVLGVAIIIGLIGTLVPAFPGTVIILLGAVGHAFLTDFEPLTINFLLMLLALFVMGWLGQYAVTGLGSKKFGASKYGILGACIGMLAGIFLPIVGGIFIGAFVGAFMFEIVFALKKTGEGLKAGLGAVLGTVFSLFYEFFIAAAMAALIGWRIFQ